MKSVIIFSKNSIKSSALFFNIMFYSSLILIYIYTLFCLSKSNFPLLLFRMSVTSKELLYSEVLLELNFIINLL
jgi:hypothetical protein